MSQRTNIYNYLYLQFGDKWYPGYDKENMQTAENQLEAMFKFVGPGIIEGWDVYKLTDYRENQLTLINGYLDNFESEIGQRLTYLNLNFTRETSAQRRYCEAATTSNISLSGEQTIDGISCVAGDRVLVRLQTDASENGVYVVSASSWSRASELNNNTDFNSNFLVYVETGNVYKQTLWLASWKPAGVETSFILGTSDLYFLNAFDQCVLVTPGNGIVSTFSAKTLKYNYFRYTGNNTYYVWAEPSICLQSEGICAITSPSIPDDEYYLQNDAIYIGEVNTSVKVDSNYSIQLDTYVVDEIVYGDSRNDLKNFSGSFQKALRKSFYKHVHAGGENNPSKIDLSTRVVLDALPKETNGTLNYASNIFVIQGNDNFKPTSTSSGTGKTIGFYGIPEVRLNNVKLDPTQYNLNLASSRISLKNNILSTDKLQIFLPKSPQKSLQSISLNSSNKSYGSLLTGNIVAGYSIYLSDGTTTTVTDANTNTKTTYYNRTIWSDADYLSAEVYLNGNLIDPDYYEIKPYAAELIFKSSFIDLETYDYSDVSVIIEAVGREIESKLSGKRIKDIDASSFNSGTLDSKRIINLDHIGLNRYRELASLIPSKRLFAEGNHTYFYPEIPSSDLQNTSEVFYIEKSLNVESSKYLVGNKRGFISSSDMSTGDYLNNWNIDRGQVKYFVDNILRPENVNYFKTAYALTKEGRIWSTTDFGENWIVVKNPIDSTIPSIKTTSFYISSDREEIYDKAGRFTGKYNYRYYSYNGTDDGLYTAVIADKMTENDWVWSKVKSIYNESGSILSYVKPISDVKEISTRRTEKKEGSLQISYDRTAYVAASSGNTGLFSGNSGLITRVFNEGVKGIYWIENGTTGINNNDLIWWTEQNAYITHSARYVETDDGTTVTTYWEHPLSNPITSVPVRAATTSKLSSNYSTASSPHTLTYNPYEESTLGRISASNGSTIITGTGTSFLIYSGTGASIGIGATKGADVATWYTINSIASDARIFLTSAYSGSSTASTSYVIQYPKSTFAVDGFTYSSTGVGQTVLVKNQENAIQNGVYYVSTLGSSTTNWVLARLSSVPSAGDNFRVLNGTQNAGSIWFLDKDSSAITYGTSELNWKINVFKIFSTAALGSTITSVTKRNISGSYEYLIGHTKGIGLVTDSSASGVNPTSRNLYWSSTLQGEVNAVYSKSSSDSGLGLVYAGTNRGTYVSTDFIWSSDYSNVSVNHPWIRPYTAFRKTDEVSIFNAQDSVQEYGFTTEYPYQLVKLNSSAAYGKNFFYEREYSTFYVNPWTETNAKVVVYIGNNPSTIPYILTPSLGKIQFVQSLKASQINSVYVTVIREGAFLSNIGETYHEEAIRDLVSDVDPLTTLSKSNSPTESLFFTRKPITDTALTILEFRNNTVNPVISEQVIVSIVFDERNNRYINNIIPRSSSIVFPINTQVFAVRTKKYAGIQDYISLKQSGHHYYYESVDVANTSHAALKLYKNDNTTFDPYPTVSAKSIEKETGLKNLTLVADVDASALFDPINSISYDYLGVIPTANDKANAPKSIYSLYNVSATGASMLAGTDQGLWVYGDRWDELSDLGNSSRVYYIKSNGSTLNAGTDNNLWYGTASSTWTEDITFNQPQFDYIRGSWFGGTFEAFGKEDGLSFVWTPENATAFQSDHLALVDKKRVNGLYQDKFIKITTDSQGNSKQTEVDALYVCAENGMFAVTNGATSGTNLTAYLKGREVFGGKVEDYKFYKAFRALPTPPATKTPVPMFILTNNGILKVRNWRWLDPTDAATPDFLVEKTFLSGISCYCFALDTESSPGGSEPGKSKIFVGTSNGVYRSLDEGNTFERCEKINSASYAVYDLKVFTSSITNDQVLLAATEDGLWYSIDDGDTWYEPGFEGGLITPAVSFTSRPNNNVNLGTALTSGGSLAQSFKVGAGQTHVLKASAYLNIRTELSSDSRYNTALSGNTIRAYLYSVNGSGLPLSQLAVSSTIYNPEDIINSSFVNFDFDYTGTLGTTYALVITETLAVSSISVAQWKMSNLSNPYSNGRAFKLDGSWDEVYNDTTLDYYFKIFFEASPTPTDTPIPVGAYYSGSGSTSNDWSNGTSLGVVIKDIGHLTTDIKFATSLVFDDSTSIKSSIGSTQYVYTVKDFFGTFIERNDKYIAGIGTTLKTTYFDFWQFGSSVSEKTNGFENSKIELDTNLLSLKQKGTKSELLEAVALSIVGLSPQSISEAILKTNDETNNVARVNLVVNYLNQIGALGLNTLRSWYKTDSDKQITLQKWSGSVMTDLTIYLTKSSIGSTYKWSSATYPDVEVSVNGVKRTTNYTVSATNGSVTFSGGTGLTAGDALEVYLRQDWDGTATDIKYSDTARTELIRKWSETYKPLSFVFADGDNISTDLASDIVTTAQTSWLENGVNINTFGFGRANDQRELQTLSVETDGKYFDILNGEDNGDLESSLNSFLHGQANDLYTASWVRDFEYNDPKYIKSLHASYAAATGSTCSVQFRWSNNRKDYSSWITLNSGVGYTFRKQITNLEYKINLTEGYVSNATVRPVISSLYHIETLPSERYYFTDVYDVKGSIFEYNLTANSTVPETSKLQWGICRGDSTDWADYEVIYSNRNGCLSNRQKTFQYLDQVIYNSSNGLLLNDTTGLDEQGAPVTPQIFQVLLNGAKFKNIRSDAQIAVTLASGDIVSPTTYKTDFKLGTLTFEIPLFELPTAEIVYPELQNFYEGEPTTTVDNRTYFSVNGRWPADSQLVVLKNGVINRGNYFINREDGAVTFVQELERTDIVTFFILPSNKFRIGLLVQDYDDAVANTYDFALQYSVVKNRNVFSSYLNSSLPNLTGKPKIISMSSIGSSISVSERMILDYEYNSPDGNRERNTQTKWFRYREVSGSGTTLEVFSTNSLPNYRKRTVQRLEDLDEANNYFLAGDVIYAEVSPSDGFKTGIAVTSTSVILAGNFIPYVGNVALTSSDPTKPVTQDSSTLIYSMPAGPDIILSYDYYDGSSGSPTTINNQTALAWFDKDKQISISVPTTTLDASLFSKGSQITVSLLPSNGANTGLKVFSYQVEIV